MNVLVSILAQTSVIAPDVIAVLVILTRAAPGGAHRSNLRIKAPPPLGNPRSKIPMSGGPSTLALQHVDPGKLQPRSALISLYFTRASGNFLRR